MVEEKFPEEEELVLCTVEQIMGTTVFVKLDNYNKTGVISTSEVAPGRIRNIRDYVIPNKKIVCKVLRIDQAKGQIDLSLRRVSQKDARKIIDGYNQEKAALTILRLASKNPEEAVLEIKKKYENVYAFLEKARENDEIIKDFFNKDETEKLSKLIREKIKAKKFEAKKKISLSTIASNGISIIKKALAVKDAKVTYLGAPFYLVSVESKDYKDANKKLENALLEICKKIKEAGGKVEVIEK